MAQTKNIKQERTEWKLKEWCIQFADPNIPKMSDEEVEAGVSYLRDHNYPVPADCPQLSCKAGYRPSCTMGICKIACVLCGDW